MKKDIICTICPRGCTVSVEGSANEVTSVSGYGCKRGMEFATAEFTAPVRILTTTVKIDGRDGDLLPVRSSKPLPKEKILECMEIIKKTVVSLPVKQYDAVVTGILGTDVDIVATKDVK
ncbi:MAG: DUF1667 domain-containing protein [Ruminococcaceae bacterium]|nr:DUF1667 domain-containing protein [Oscillospiraceae bacterium]